MRGYFNKPKETAETIRDGWVATGDMAKMAPDGHLYIIGVPDAVFGEAVAAFIELRPGMTATEEEIVAHCRDRIAGYKKPKHMRFLEQLPCNSTGKVQKFELQKDFAAMKRE